MHTRTLALVDLPN